VGDEWLAGDSSEIEGELAVDIRYRAAKHGRFPFSYEINQSSAYVFYLDLSIIPQFHFHNECSNLVIILSIADLVEQEYQQLTQIGKPSALPCYWILKRESPGTFPI